MKRAASGTPVRRWDIRRGDHAAARLARGEFRDHVRRAFQECDGTHFDAELVFGELVTNAVRHARREVHVELFGATLRVVDDGDCFPGNPSNFYPPDKEGGRGLAMATKLAARVDVRKHPSGCTVTAELRVA